VRSISHARIPLDPFAGHDCLASGDVETDRAWIVVLEVAQAGAAHGRYLVRDGLAGWALECRDDTCRTRRESLYAVRGLSAALAVEGRGLSGNAAKL